jgi:hypothetical protein
VVKKYIEERYGCPITSLDRPRGFQHVEAPRLQDNRHTEGLKKDIFYSADVRKGKLIPCSYQYFCYITASATQLPLDIRAESGHLFDKGALLDKAIKMTL